MKSENFFICVFYTYIHTYIKICTFHVSALVIDTQREKKKVFKYPFVIIKNPSVLFLQKNSIIINKESNFRTFSRTLRTRTARIAKGSSEGKVVAQRQWLTLPVATNDSGRLGPIADSGIRNAPLVSSPEALSADRTVARASVPLATKSLTGVADARPNRLPPALLSRVRGQRSRGAIS